MEPKTKTKSNDFAINSDKLCLVVMPTSWPYHENRESARGLLNCRQYARRWESWQFCGLMLPHALRAGMMGQGLLGSHMGVFLVRWPEGWIPKTLLDIVSLEKPVECEDVLDLPSDSVDAADCLGVVLLGEALRFSRKGDEAKADQYGAAASIATLCSKNLAEQDATLSVLTNHSLANMINEQSLTNDVDSIPRWPSQVSAYLRSRVAKTSG